MIQKRTPGRSWTSFPRDTLSARQIKQRKDHLRLAVDLVDSAIVIAVIDPIIVDIIAAILDRHVHDPGRDVLPNPGVTVESVTRMRSGKAGVGIVGVGGATIPSR